MKKNSILILLTLAITAQLFAQGDLNKTFTGVKRIRMTTAAGDCILKKGSGSTVKVSMKHTYNDADFQPTVEQDGERLTIKEKTLGRNMNGSSNWILEVPDNIEINFTTGSGNMEASNLNFTGDITTGSGDFNFTNVKGDIRGTTGSGGITLDQFDGELRSTTGSGNIKIESSKGKIEVTCGSGNIRITNSQAAFKATTGSGGIDGRNVTLNGSSKFTTGSGDAEISLAASPKYDLSIASGSGDAAVNFNGNEISGEIVMRANKRNGGIQAPFDFDKSEEIENGYNNTTIQKTVKKGNGTNRISISTGSGDAILKK